MPGRKRSPTKTEAIYQLKVTLRGSKPPIWRRLQVPATTTLADLHPILQVAMGWHNAHLHQFIVDGAYYSAVNLDDPFMETHDAGKAILRQIAPREGSKFVYEYDFGDSWEHVILVEKIVPPEPDVHYPRCLTGKRAGPPEDCGGIWGYSDLLEILAQPDHPEREEWLDWLGEEFDPAAFDVDQVNQTLQRLG